MGDSDRVDPKRVVSANEERREQIRLEVADRREAVLLRVSTARQVIVVAAALACCGVTIFIDVVAPVSSSAGNRSSSSGRGLSGGSAPGAAADAGVAVSGAS